MERSTLSGTERRVIVSSGLVRPTAITIDYPNNVLYWLDPGSNKLLSSDLDGNGVTAFYNGGLVSGLVGLTCDEVITRSIYTDVLKQSTINMFFISLLHLFLLL